MASYRSPYPSNGISRSPVPGAPNDTRSSVFDSARDISPSAEPAGRHSPSHAHDSQGYAREELRPSTSETPSAYFPRGRKSQSGISLRSFVLGNTISATLLASAYLLANGHSTWRAPFFISLLSLFHFLEFYITARCNTPQATIDAFLLSSNGAAYNIAHASALVECLLRNGLLKFLGFSRDSSDVTRSDDARDASIFSARLASLGFWTTVAGFALVIVGQLTRSLAMAHAGRSFNHTVQTTKASSHKLVVTGIYGVLRHPSYFGFFWWAIGTQLVCGNVVCLAGYVVVLWRFFDKRIRREEQYLIGFFGEEYVRYRRTARVGIPGIA